MRVSCAADGSADHAAGASVSGEPAQWSLSCEERPESTRAFGEAGCPDAQHDIAAPSDA